MHVHWRGLVTKSGSFHAKLDLKKTKNSDADVSEIRLQMEIRFSFPDHFRLYSWLADLIRVRYILNEM